MTRRLTPLCLLLCLLLIRPVLAGEEGPTPVGETIPAFTLPVPESPEAREYLGLKGNEPFSLSQVVGKIIILEVFGAF